MAKTKLPSDPIAEKLDELASLGEYWQESRAKGCMPKALRGAMIMVIHETKNLLDKQRREKSRDGR